MLLIGSVSGHQNLLNHNLLLHRDISAGNVLMSVDPEVERGAAGFVCDIELSKKLPANSPTDDSPEPTVRFFCWMNSFFPYTI